MQTALDLPDPRTFRCAGDAPPHAAKLHRLAAASLEADVGTWADACDRDIRAALAAAIEEGSRDLGMLVDTAPSTAIARHLWRQLDAVCREAPRAGVAARLFAIPVVIVAGCEDAARKATLSAVCTEPARLGALLEQHGALGGNRNFGLADALVAAEAIDLPRLPELLAWQRLADEGSAQRDFPLLPAAPVRVARGAEGVHLRFLVGLAVAPAGVDPLATRDIGPWGVPLARELNRQIAVPGVTVLALPRAPDRPLPAVRAGRLAQRQVAAEIFCGNALRRLRASGEPVAVISAHRSAEAPAGGELRLSLASPFAERSAEGFRCPLHVLDRVPEVVAMLTELLADCRVADVRAVAGVHADRDPATGELLLFRPETIPVDATRLH